MNSLFRRSAAALLFWAVLFAALLLFFLRYGPEETSVPRDAARVLTVLTEDGPVEMTMADYLPGALAAEMPVSFGPEALKAQAVAARTFALSSSRHSGGDVCTESACCLAWKSPDELRTLWGDEYDAYLGILTDAVAATDGQVLTYGGELIQAVFHASSAGSTEDSGAIWSPLPYLVSVPSPETAANVPELISTARFSPEELAGRLALEADAPPETWLIGTELDDAGRVRTLFIADSALNGSAVRAALELRSTAFTVVFEDGDFVFTVYGSGHGVGMSQYGAKLLAAQGYSYDDILAHYYPGTELVTPQDHQQL